uniref:Collagen triple helix repeat protein n=1 Tax=Parascaris univalens TaxID=6257 RepID=A0A915BMW8_PARUN
MNQKEKEPFNKTMTTRVKWHNGCFLESNVYLLMRDEIHRFHSEYSLQKIVLCKLLQFLPAFQEKVVLLSTPWTQRLEGRSARKKVTQIPYLNVFYINFRPREEKS